MATKYPEGFEPIQDTQTQYPEGFEPESPQIAFINSLTPLEQRLGGQIVDAVTGQRDPSQINILLNQARNRGAQAQSALNRAESISQTSPLESAILGAAKVPVGLTSLASIPLNMVLEASGPQGRAILDRNQDIASFLNRELTEGSAVNPISGALGQSAATRATMGSGGIVQNLATGQLGNAARQLAVAAPINVGIGTGIRELAGADTTTEDVLNDVTLSLLGGRIPSNQLPVLTAPAAENALSRTLRESAEKNVVQALLRGGGTKQEKLIAERLAPQILDRPMSETLKMTGKGLQEKATAQKQAAGEAIGEFGALKGETNIKPILDELEELKTSERHIINGKVMNPMAVQHIDEVKELIAQHGDVVPLEVLNDIKKSFSDVTYGAKGSFPNLAEGSLLKYKKFASDALRESLAKENPDFAILNKQYNFWTNFEKVVSSTNTRVKPQSGFSSKLASIAGFATGTGMADSVSRGIVAKLFFDAIRSPGWKLTSARVKNNIADAVAASDPERLFNTLKQVQGFDPEQVLRTSAVQAADAQMSSDQVP